MELYRQAVAHLDAGVSAALGVVLHTRGSTPQKAGAKALFYPDGSVQGTLGGGCLEAEAQQRALLTLDEGAPCWFTVRLDELDGWDDGLICGGSATILTTPLLKGNRDAYLAACEAQQRGEAGTLVTILSHPHHAGSEAIWVPEGATPPAGLSSADTERAVRQEKSLLVPGQSELDSADEAYFLEPISPPPRLFVIGAGHIGKALSHFASELGFSVTVIDDRPAFANQKNLPDAHAVQCGNITEELGKLQFSERDYVVIVTRGHRHDGEALSACVQHELAYLGLIGSRRKGLLLRERLLEENHATEEQIARVVTPMGLDLGGPTVNEIALSIAAQLVTVRRKGRLNAPPLQFDKTAAPEPGHKR